MGIGEQNNSVMVGRVTPCAPLQIFIPGPFSTHKNESQRDSIIQPRVAEPCEATLGNRENPPQPQRGCTRTSLGSAAVNPLQRPVPKERPTIARRFNAGFTNVFSSSPEGTAELEPRISTTFTESQRDSIIQPRVAEPCEATLGNRENPPATPTGLHVG